MKVKNKKSINLRFEKSNYLKPLFWVAFLGIVSLLVFLTIELSTVGAELTNLQEQESRLEGENRFLSEEIARSNSLNSFEETAENLGFVKPEKVIYITSDEGIAKL